MRAFAVKVTTWGTEGTRPLHELYAVLSQAEATAIHSVSSLVEAVDENIEVVSVLTDKLAKLLDLSENQPVRM